MKKLLSLATICWSFIGLAEFAHAGFYLEPYFSYGPTGGIEGEIETSLPSPYDVLKTDETVKSAIHYGARFGWNFSGYQFGAVYQQGTLKTENDDSDESDSKVTDAGFHLGAKLGSRFRVYLEYLIDAHVEDEDMDDPFKGSGYKVGFGYFLLDWFTVNLDYAAYQYDQLDADGIEGVALDAHVLSLSLGFPLPFGK